MSELTFNQYEKDAIVSKVHHVSIATFIETLGIPDPVNQERLRKILCFIYPVIGILGEAGEIAEKLKKVIRDKNFEVSEEDKLLFIKELGDVQWYVGDSAQALESSIQEVAQTNIDKLKSRRDRGVLQGSGDNR